MREGGRIVATAAASRASSRFPAARPVAAVTLVGVAPRTAAAGWRPA